MKWIGTWKNQYGSTLEITHDSDNKIAGTFMTALRDSSFYGRKQPVAGVHNETLYQFRFRSLEPGGRRDRVLHRSPGGRQA